MELDLTGRVALVTGGSRGIGAAIVRSLAAEGCSVVFTHLGDAEGAATVCDIPHGTVSCFESDVADPAATADVFAQVQARHGWVELLVCNAGITRDAVVWKLSDEAWRQVLDVNLSGVFHYNRELARQVRERARNGEQTSRSRIVNIASINGLRGKFGQVNYAASKGGVIALTKSVARELGRFGTTANAVAPGMVLTDMARDLPAPVLAAAREETVLDRLAEPADVADLVTWLCSSRARHITGQCLQVDGGQRL